MINGKSKIKQNLKINTKDILEVCVNLNKNKRN